MRRPMQLVLVAAVPAMLFAGTARASAVSGACEEPSVLVVEDLSGILATAILKLPNLESTPITIHDPMPSALLCETPVLVTWDEDLRTADIEVRIPLAQLDTRPLSPGAFSREIARVEVPAPWSVGTSKWRVEGDGNGSTLVITMSGENSASASAWLKVTGRIHVRLASGQLVVPLVSTGTTISDETAYFRRSRRHEVEVFERHLQKERNRIADARATIASLSSRASGESELDEVQIQALREAKDVHSRAPAILAAAQATLDEARAAEEALQAQRRFARGASCPEL